MPPTRSAVTTVLWVFAAACSSAPQGAAGDTAAVEKKAAVAPRRPVIVGHRGASGYRPEHTEAAYRLAVEQGADFIEPDVVVTKDGVLVVRHENEIGGTTNVADHPEFADRRTVRTIDGEELDGWFTEDFTLAELKTLRARERLPEVRPGSAGYDGQFEILTLTEVLELAAVLERESGRRIGVYPETKHPTYFRSIGLPIEKRLVEELAAHGYRGADDPVFIQSFEVSNLRELNQITEIRLAQLIWIEGSPADAPNGPTYAEMVTPAGLREIATYADVAAPERGYLIPRSEEGKLGEPTSFVADAHAAGLAVVPYTFRAEDTFLSADHQGDPVAEFVRYLETGVDGFFTDNPDVGHRAVRRLLGE